MLYSTWSSVLLILIDWLISIGWFCETMLVDIITLNGLLYWFTNVIFLRNRSETKGHFIWSVTWRYWSRGIRQQMWEICVSVCSVVWWKAGEGALTTYEGHVTVSVCADILRYGGQCVAQSGNAKITHFVEHVFWWGKHGGIIQQRWLMNCIPFLTLSFPTGVTNYMHGRRGRG